MLLSLSLTRSLSLSLSHNAVVQSSALQFFFLPHKVAEHKYALFICLLPLSQWESYGCFSKRLQRAHQHIVRTHRLLTSVLSTGVPCMAEHANERSGPSTSISPSNGRDTNLIQLYVQTTKTREKENSSRCINLKALEKVKPPRFVQQALNSSYALPTKMHAAEQREMMSLRLHSATQGYTDCVQHCVLLQASYGNTHWPAEPSNVLISPNLWHWLKARPEL